MGSSVGRLDEMEEKKLKGRVFYEVGLVSEENEHKIRYYLIDGTTGKLVFKTFYYLRYEGENPYSEYLDKIYNRKTPDNFYMYFKGKDYTKREWDAFERAFYEKYKGKKKISDLLYEDL